MNATSRTHKRIVTATINASVEIGPEQMGRRTQPGDTVRVNRWVCDGMMAAIQLGPDHGYCYTADLSNIVETAVAR